MPGDFLRLACGIRKKSPDFPKYESPLNLIQHSFHNKTKAVIDALFGEKSPGTFLGSIVGQ